MPSASPSAAHAAPVPGAALRAAFAAPLAVPALEAAFAAAGGGPVEVEALLATGSTNADLLAVARAQQPARPRLRATLAQASGRGRLGRRWHAAPGAALLFSLAWPLDGPGLPAASTLAVGAALADGLAAAGVAVRLKWPNDLLLAGAKLGGILAELARDRAGRATLVVGVGVNLWLDAAMRASIGQPAAALADALPLAPLAAQRELWIGRLAAAAAAALADCAARGFVPWQARYMQRFAFLGRPVQLFDQGNCVAQGRALGIDGDGRLLLDDAGRVRAFAAGELSLRAAAARETEALR